MKVKKINKQIENQSKKSETIMYHTCAYYNLVWSY